ncbi:hypothetical protein ZWY2020_001319 [Hordeum vulgare]|nr:hypothetical protein ZWY2020_001319 [Hordeum vulgare]
MWAGRGRSLLCGRCEPPPPWLRPGAVAVAATDALRRRAAAGEGRGADHDTSELARLMQVAELLGAAEVAAVDEDLRERDPAGTREERHELLEVACIHGKVALVDGGAEPPRDGAYPR